MRGDRHNSSIPRSLRFGLLNIRSLNNKIDDLLEVKRDKKIDVFLLTETWHDSESTSLGRLRASNFEVLDRPRPRTKHDVLTTNHGGVAAFSSPGIRLSMISCGPDPSTFEHLSFRVSSASTSCSVLLVYRTGPINNLFFAELSTLLARLTTCSEPIIVAGDFNIHIERSSDPDSRALIDTLESYGLRCSIDTPTHRLGGTLDIVATRSDLPPPLVLITDPDLSDHFLLSWVTSLPRPPPVYRTTVTRPWKLLNNDDFRDALQSSAICDEDCV